ncbi:MAG: YggS family pyridoxal phosphate-dependent enzyme [Neomegalonema sp.]|nr:YggS family pyridoxal phosphate-dependent enzyme [Neomegalonema sp.]
MALEEIEERIARAESLAGRDPGSVTLVAVSKVQSDDRVDTVLAAGHRVFGENRVQEAQERWSERRPLFPDLELHLIGPLQTNKVRAALELFDVIESVDRPKLVDKLADLISEMARSPKLLVQVNTGAEEQKAGVSLDELPSLLDHCRDRGLSIAGLMAIPPADEDPAPHFALLRKLAERYGLAEISMGMSADFETAISLGATSVRVGSALFGSRQP